MKTIDNGALAFYEAGAEYNRLRTGIGRIEFARTKEILIKTLPEPPAVIYDIGGAYGEYAWWLSSLGYEVHLFDLSERNIAMSEMLSGEYPEYSLAASEVADARSVPRDDSSADAVLLMGPIYHLTDKEDRIKALRESFRLLKPGGKIYTAALTPFSVLLHNITIYEPFVEGGRRRLEEDRFLKMVERELTDGCHINPENKNYAGIASAHFHTASKLKEELAEGGFSASRVHGIMGGAWLVPNLDDVWEDETTREALMNTVRLIDEHEEIIGLSGHLLAVSEKCVDT